MRIDINQLVDEGALQVVDEPLVKRVMGVEQLEVDRLSGMNWQPDTAA